MLLSERLAVLAAEPAALQTPGGKDKKARGLVPAGFEDLCPGVMFFRPRALSRSLAGLGGSAWRSRGLSRLLGPTSRFLVMGRGLMMLRLRR